MYWSWWSVLALLSLDANIAHAIDVESSQPLLSARASVLEPHLEGSNDVCVVVRTYWGHGGEGSNSLTRLLESLRRQTHERWEALLIVMDSKPFEDLYDILDRFNDSRVWLHADWIDKTYTPKKKDGTWERRYHTRLYSLTDEAARACHPRSEWLVITNGDNQYHVDAFQTLVDAAAGTDVVAWDMYSRYHRPTGIPCERFKADPLGPRCKPNRMRWCHTDLGASAYRWRRWIDEDMRFAHLRKPGPFTGEDGMLAEEISEREWPVGHMHGRCLFDQGPNPQMCARLGGVWDDRMAHTPQDFGGHCASEQDLDSARADGFTEIVNVTLSSDGHASGFQSYAGDGDVSTIACMRPAQGYRHMLIPSFGKPCMEPTDVGLMEEFDVLASKGKVQTPKLPPAQKHRKDRAAHDLHEYHTHRYKQPTPAAPPFPAEMSKPAKRRALARDATHATNQQAIEAKIADLHDELR